MPGPPASSSPTPAAGHDDGRHLPDDDPPDTAAGGIVAHASAVAVAGRAVLIRGASGSGKSALALRMLALGARLVADDRTRLWRAAGTVMAAAPDGIRGRIEARGVGILNAPASGPVPLALVVQMDAPATARLPEPETAEILGVAFPCAKNPGAEHFPAALMLYLEHGRHA